MIISHTTMITPWGSIENYKDKNVEEEIEKLKSRFLFSTKLDEDVFLKLELLFKNTESLNKEVVSIEENLSTLIKTINEVRISLNNIRILSKDLFEKI